MYTTYMCVYIYIYIHRRTFHVRDPGDCLPPPDPGRHAFAVSQRISLLFQSDKGFFTTPLSKDFFTIPVRQRILYFSSLKGLLHYPSPTKDSLFVLSQRTSFLSQSDNGFFIFPLSKDF